MAFPRRSSLTRVLTVLVVGFFGLWIWSSSPGDPPSDIILSIGQELKKESTRTNTPVEAKQTHHHNNQTLQKMMSNMTLMKANKTALQNIIKTVNDSRMDTIIRVEDIDQSKVANPHRFKYLLNAPNVCKNKDVFMIVYVHTAPSHYKRRMVIRQTWGNYKYYKDVIVRVIFVMGLTIDKPQVQQALAFESEQYGDIIQEDFIDSYKNLTYKGVAALKWISNHCRNAKFVLKTDDDIFVNTFSLLRHLKSLEAHGVNNKGLIMCLVWNRMKVMRTGKWKVSEQDFKDSYYPTYCSGSAYTLSIDVAIKMHEVSYHVPFFWVDDFYITGLLPLKAGFKHKQFISTYVLDGRKLEEKFTSSQWFTYIFSHVHNLNTIQSVWDRLVHLAQGDVAPTVKFAMPGELSKFEEEYKKVEAAKEAARMAKANSKKS